MALRHERQTLESSLVNMARANSRAAEYLAQAAQSPFPFPESPFQTMGATLSAAVGIRPYASDSKTMSPTENTLRLISQGIAEHQKANEHSLRALDDLKRSFENKKLSRLIALGLGSLLAYAIFSSD